MSGAIREKKLALPPAFYYIQVLARNLSKSGGVVLFHLFLFFEGSN